MLFSQVDPKRQKLLGLKTKDGKMATDEAAIADLAIKPNTKVTCGTQHLMRQCALYQQCCWWPCQARKPL
jgi:hypothetical protein